MSSLSYKELQRLCTKNKNVLPAGALCRKKGMTKAVLQELLISSGVIDERGKLIAPNASSRKSSAQDVDVKKTSAKKIAVQDVDVKKTAVQNRYAKKIAVQNRYAKKIAAQNTSAKKIAAQDTQSKESLRSETKESSSFSDPRNVGLFAREVSFYLHENICAFVKGDDITDLSSEHCNPVSSRVSRNLIDVAARKIFVDPIRSISELILNSVDAYREKAGRPKIGKFGMGFFSVLYFVIEENATLKILSHSTGGSIYEAKIFPPDQNGIRVSYKPLPEEDFPTIGAEVSLTFSRDYYSKKRFEIEAQLKLLADLDDVAIRAFMPSKETNLSTFGFKDRGKLINRVKSQKKLGNISFRISLDDTKAVLTVSDEATGISPYVLFDNLLVPSSSTKLVSKGQADSSFVSATRADEKIGQSVTRVTVGHVEVFRHSNLSRGRIYTLSLPPDVPVPVSRDSVIVTDSVYSRVKDEVRRLLYAGGQPEDRRLPDFRDITLALTKLAALASTDANFAQAITDVIDDLYADETYLFIPGSMSLSGIYKLVLKDIPGIAIGSRYNIRRVEGEILSRATDTRTDVLPGRTIVFLPSIQVASYGLPDILFVDAELKNLSISQLRSRISNSIITEVIDPGRKFSNVYEGYIEKTTAIVASLKNYADVYEMSLVGTPSAVLSTNVALILQLPARDQEDIEIAFGYQYNVLSGQKPQMAYGNKPEMFLFAFGTSEFSYSSGDVILADVLGASLAAYVDKSLQFFYWIHDTLQSKDQINVASPILLLELCALVTAASEKQSRFPAYFKSVLNIFTHPVHIYIYFSILLYFFKYKSVRRLPSQATMQIYSNFLADKGTPEQLAYYMSGSGLAPVRMPELVDTSISIFEAANSTAPSIAVPKDPNATVVAVTSAAALLGAIFEGEDPKLSSANDMKAASGLQAVQIVINEGTSRPYAEAALTELAQNSYDAYRSTGSSSIDVRVKHSDAGFSVADDVGMTEKVLVSLLVPFYSTKGGSSETTGEIGTGFFTVFRQPWCERVVIETSKNRTGLIVEAVPVVDKKSGRALDVNYTVSKTLGHKNGTTVTIFYSEVETVYQNSLVASYLYNAISQMPNISLTVNEERVEPMKARREVEVPGLLLLRVHESLKKQSYVYTNGVPLSKMTDFKFIEKLPWKKSIRELLYMGISLDLASGIYRATQGREKVYIDSAVEQSMLDAFYEAILYISVVNPVYMERIEKSAVSTGNLGSVFVIEGSKLLTYKPAGKLTLKELLLRAKNIAGALSGTEAYALLVEKGTPMTPAQDVFVSVWLKSKRRKPGKGVALRGGGPTDATKDYLQAFVDAFWEMGKKLETEGKLQGTNFRKAGAGGRSPRLRWLALPDRMGYYTMETHEITLAYNMIPSINADVRIFRKDPRIATLRAYESLAQLIKKYPGATLIHELAHAWLFGTGHVGHEDVTVTIFGQTQTLEFEYACSAVYSALLQEGLEEEIQKID